MIILQSEQLVILKIQKENKEMKRDLEIDKTPYSNYVFLLNPNDKKTIKLLLLR